MNAPVEIASRPGPSSLSMQRRGVIERWAEFLPVTGKTPVITLHEGDTPLIPCPRLSGRVGRGCEVFVKYEGLNPSGSFKDRGMTVAVSKAVEEGARVVVCASTGNTSASAAAYAARAGIACAVVLPAGKIASGKLVQAFAYGARVIAIDGTFDDALRIVRELADQPGFSVVNSINPHRIAGQKSTAFEIVEELGDAPDFHILPVGNAGNITAYWAGYCEFHAIGRAERRPRMIGFQAAGAAPIVLGRVVEDPETIATAIRIGNPASWVSAKRAIKDSEGAIDTVTDEEIIEAQAWLASREGIFVEPASAAAIAGLFKLARGNGVAPGRGVSFPEGSRIVCTVTGNGLKDPEAVQFAAPQVVAPDEKEVRRLLVGAAAVK